MPALSIWSTQYTQQPSPVWFLVNYHKTQSLIAKRCNPILNLHRQQQGRREMRPKMQPKRRPKRWPKRRRCGEMVRSLVARGLCRLLRKRTREQKESGILIKGLLGMVYCILSDPSVIDAFTILCKANSTSVWASLQTAKA